MEGGKQTFFFTDGGGQILEMVVLVLGGGKCERGTSPQELEFLRARRVLKF